MHLEAAFSNALHKFSGAFYQFAQHMLDSGLLHERPAMVDNFMDYGLG